MHTRISMATINEIQEKTAGLDSAALHLACVSWQQRERTCLLHVLIHIAEVAKRKLFLDRGYMHLGEYCQQHLGLSESEAWTRIYVAKASLPHPELLLALESGSISLSVAGLLARCLSPENKNELLQRCAGKTKKWVEEFLVAYGKPIPQARSSLRACVIAAPREESEVPLSLHPQGTSQARHPQGTSP